MNSMNRGWTWMVGAALLATLAGTAGAQEKKPDDEALKGPAVKDDAPGTRKFTQKGQQRGQQEVPIRVFMKALEVIRGEQASEDVRLTAEQNEQLKAHMDGYQAEVAKFREANGEKIRALAAKLSPEDRKKAMQRLAPYLNERGGRPGEKGDKKARPGNDKPADEMGDPMTPVDEKESNGAMYQLKKLAENAPNQANVQAKLWTVLTDAQKPLVQKELERIQKEQREKNKPADGAKPGEPGADPIMDNPRIPQELKDKLKDMTPEERRAALREYRQKRQQDGKGKQPEKGGEKLPPPGMDDVEVPAPEQPK